jgi:hypothetical protein
MEFVNPARYQTNRSKARNDSEGGCEGDNVQHCLHEFTNDDDGQDSASGEFTAHHSQTVN